MAHATNRYRRIPEGRLKLRRWLPNFDRFFTNRDTASLGRDSLAVQPSMAYRDLFLKVFLFNSSRRILL
jgi:hypothetical protein